MPIETVKRGEQRFYYDTDKPDDQVPGVTTVVDMLPKEFLQWWIPLKVATLAADKADELPAMVARNRGRAIGYLKGAARRYTKERADIGTAAHNEFEYMIKGGPPRSVPLGMRGYQRQFADFLRVVQPELVAAECTVWSDRYKYAGRFDAFLNLMLNAHRELDLAAGTPVLVADDWKTTKYISPSVALQMSAYVNADVIITPEGARIPVPKVDGAVVLHITPEGWALHPVDITWDPVFKTFLHLRGIFDWETIHSKHVVGDAIAKGGNP